MPTVTAHAVQLQRACRLVLTNTSPTPALDVKVSGRAADGRPLRIADRLPLSVLRPGDSRDVTVEGAEDAAVPWQLSVDWNDPTGRRHRDLVVSRPVRVG